MKTVLRTEIVKNGKLIVIPGEVSDSQLKEIGDCEDITYVYGELRPEIKARLRSTKQS